MTVPKGTGQQVFRTRKILLHTRWLQHMSSLAMQILLTCFRYKAVSAWIWAKLCSLPTYSLNKSLRATGKIHRNLAAKGTIQTNLEHFRNDRNYQLWLRNTFLATLFHSILRAAIFFACIYSMRIVWMPSAQVYTNLYRFPLEDNGGK